MADSSPSTPAFEPVSHADWRARVENDLDGADFDERLVSRSAEGLAIQPLFPDDGPASAVRPDSPAAGWSAHAEYDATDPPACRAALLLDLERAVAGLRISGTNQFDLSWLIQGVDLGEVALHFEDGDPRKLGAALVQVARERGLSSSSLRGGLGAHGETATTGLFEWCARELPGFHVARVDTTGDQRAGAGCAQEVGIALSAGAGLLRRVACDGLALDEVAPRIEFTFSLGTDMFLEISKLRAARLAWARLVAAAGGGPGAQRMRQHARTSERHWTARDPWVNLLRGTTQAFAAAVSGADSITVLPFDACLGESDRLARRLATNTQAILAREAHLAAAVDPGAGSGYIEKLTANIAREAWAFFQKIEAAGGHGGAAATELITRAVAEVAGEEARRVATREQGIVGVSQFPVLDEALLERSPPVAPDKRRHISVPFERLRARSDRFEQETGAPPRVFLANIGASHEHRPRASFAANLLAAGGLQAIESDGFADAGEAVTAFEASGARLCVICSSDARYTEVIPELAPALARAGAEVIVAGRPGDREAAWNAAGVAYYAFAGCNTIALLDDLLTAAGVEA